MKRKSLELLCINKRIGDLREIIAEAHDEIAELQGKTSNYYRRQFFNTYGISAREAYREYTARLWRCCHQGGRG